MALTVILLCLSDSLNCLSLGANNPSQEQFKNQDVLSEIKFVMRRTHQIESLINRPIRLQPCLIQHSFKITIPNTSVIEGFPFLGKCSLYFQEVNGI